MSTKPGQLHYLLATAAAFVGAFVALIFGGMFLLSVAGLLFAAYGLRSLSWGRKGEAFFAPLGVDINATSRPSFPADDAMFPRRGLLRHWFQVRNLVHSIYLDPSAGEAVAKWIASRSEHG